MCFVEPGLVRILASFTLAVARSTPFDVCSSSWIRAASNSSRLISFAQSISVQEAIIRSTGMMGFCPYISSADMYPVTELWVVLSENKIFLLMLHVWGIFRTIVAPRLDSPL